MPYEIGAKVKLTGDVQVTPDDPAGRSGLPGPLFLSEGLGGIVTGVAQEAGGPAQDHLASFDQQVRGGHLDAFAASLVEDLRQKLIGAVGAGTGVGTRFTYKVRFENGFVLGGLEEARLASA
ncbi:hypothetical protein ACIRD3_05515 [Kitasatospora sp. NPDC093550]|uniref:hypothetical protein n=1 Tax=Kitasatospora sp. NPDC093550 TaxID=3364089 RepID=UPI00382086A4